MLFKGARLMSKNIVVSEHQIPRLIPVAKAAGILGQSESTVWAHIKSGRIKAVRLGRRATRIPDTELHRIAAHGFSEPR
jgi:excisionase family DNA binding protein